MGVVITPLQFAAPRPVTTSFRRVRARRLSRVADSGPYGTLGLFLPLGVDLMGVRSALPFRSDGTPALPTCRSLQLNSPKSASLCLYLSPNARKTHHENHQFVAF